MDAAQRELNDQIDLATQRLLGTARIITEPDLRAPSLLPGWTRARVLTHVASGADAMRHLLTGVRTDRNRSGHASAGTQEPGLRNGAGPRPEELMASLADTAMVCALRLTANAPLEHTRRFGFCPPLESLRHVDGI